MSGHETPDGVRVIPCEVVAPDSSVEEVRRALSAVNHSLNVHREDSSSKPRGEERSIMEAWRNGAEYVMRQVVIALAAPPAALVVVPDGSRDELQAVFERAEQAVLNPQLLEPGAPDSSAEAMREACAKVLDEEAAEEVRYRQHNALVPSQDYASVERQNLIEVLAKAVRLTALPAPPAALSDEVARLLEIEEAADAVWCDAAAGVNDGRALERLRIALGRECAP